MTTPTLTLSGFLLARIADDLSWRGGRRAGRSGLLANCKAKRVIVDLHTVAHYCADDTLQDVVAPPYFGVAENVRTCPTLLALAQPYADHEDFRDEWRI